MADNHTKEVRSYNMSRIRGKNTKPEEFVRKYLFSRGLRYRKHDKRLPGKPDIVLPKYKTIISVFISANAYKLIIGKAALCIREMDFINLQATKNT